MRPNSRRHQKPIGNEVLRSPRPEREDRIKTPLQSAEAPFFEVILDSLMRLTWRKLKARGKLVQREDWRLREERLKNVKSPKKNRPAT